MATVLNRSSVPADVGFFYFLVLLVVFRFLVPGCCSTSCVAVILLSGCRPLLVVSPGNPRF
jgi:hypothetical protein